MTVSRPEVLGVAPVAGGVELALRIPPSLEFLPDHFPRFALVPGVVQLDWAIALGRHHLGLAGECHGITGLKFQHPLRPGARVTLRLAADGDELDFSYRLAARPCSSGRIRLARQ